MVIIKQTPLTLAEVSELVGEGKKQDELKKFIKQFSKITPEKAKQMREELQKLDLIKLKETHIVKIIDFMPEDAEDLNKILHDVSLDQNEVDKILEVVKKF